MHDEKILQLALNFIPNVGAVSVRSMVAYCGGLEALFGASQKKLEKVPGIGAFKAGSFLKHKKAALKKAAHEYDVLLDQGIKVIYYLDEDYPAKLSHYQDAPLLLYVKGDIDLNYNRMVAIVGTRTPTTYGVTQCQKIVQGLQAYAAVIVSGLAYGIDTIAHRFCIKTGMPTIGVLGNGINKIYPSANRNLASKMVNSGAVISEFPLDTLPDREHFPKRNRIIAAMSDAVVVIESAEKGGSIITAEYANIYHKDVFAIPGKNDDAYSSGCNMLIKSHKAHLCSSAKDLAYIMRWQSDVPNHQMQLQLDLQPEEEEIFNLIKRDKIISLDTLIDSTMMSLPKLNAMLLNLEFKGLVKSIPGKNYILV